MSKLRPSLGNGEGMPCMRNGTAYLMVYTAVQARHGLVHGKLQDHGEYCAIGSYFATNARTALPTDLIDEVAAINDSVPHLTERQRRLHVMKWLRWKLSTLNMPGFSRWKGAA